MICKRVRKVRIFALALALAAVAGGASAQMYTWKDARGVTHFSDQPPPAGAAKAAPAIKTVPRAGASQPALPYALNEAVKRNPVVLYTTSSCTACDQGRALLQQRGVPFSEKTVNSNEDQQKLKAAGSDARLPLLVVGGARHIGFEAVAWQEALTAANYPLQSRLPAGWRQAPAVAAAPAPAAQPAPELVQQPPAMPQVTPQKPPPENAPPGFRF
ncbi:MAG: glutaredoxin family protein [Massilia sp.]|jgi:glutaredoxin|nr:glutaredoxin family protein [Massilia sp.]